ncbi:MAG: transglutaminase family protein, partial [Rhodocyclaceae bacterium]|nr:transglutaminase family protein [Rhodocyclaceae bacterium]
MRRLPSICSTLLVLALLAGLPAGLAHAAPHNEQPPLPAEAVQAVRAAQHRRSDLLAGALERHLHETRALSDRAEALGARLGASAARSPDDDTELANRRAEAAAKRQEIQSLRDEIFGRLDAAIRDAEGRGAGHAAAEGRAMKRRLGTRFANLAGDLAALQNADRSNLGPRSRQASERIEAWLAARPVAPIPPPNWTQAQPQPAVELPAAATPPRFVLDTLWLLRHYFADAGGRMRVALRSTPPEAGACTYTAADLADSAEAPKSHADIVALARELDYNPARMFEWVNQNVVYEPYFGSLKGGVPALWARAGGATDQASLLIALLRAANVPARYVRGTVQLVDGTPKGADGRGPRWIGAKSYQAAANLLASNGNPSASYGSNSVGLAHVWVEACLPYSAYRGAALDDSGHRWIPLDPSYKEHRTQAGIPVDAGFDFDYTSWLASRIDLQGRYRLPQESFADQAEAHARTKAPNFANTTLADIPYRSQIKRSRFDILPIVPPYEVVKYDSWSGVLGESAETAALPDRHRYRLQVSVRNKSGTGDPVAGNLLAQKTLNLADLAASRLTLAFRGASGADQSAYDTWLNAIDPAAAPTCAATANVVPVLRVGGAEQTQDAGAGSTTLCAADNVLQLKVTVAELPANAGVVSSTYYTNIGAASLHALHAYAWHTSDTYLAQRAEQLLAAVRANSNANATEAVRDAIEGEFLNIAAARYSRYVADASRHAGGLFGESGTSGISLGLTSAQVKVNYLFDLPYGLFRKGFLIDWPGGLYTGTRLDAPSSTDRRAFKLAGFAGSAYEAYIWQETADLDAISTTRGLQFAREQGIEMLQINTSADWTAQKCKLTNTCADGALNTNPTGTTYSTSHVSQIETAYVNAGFKLTLPRRLIQYPDAGGWLGATFYGEKFVVGGTSSAAFPINGYSGGVTVEAGGATAASGTGETAGGYTGGSTPVSPAYNPALNTGTVPDTTAPVAAQQQGANSFQMANGF